MLLVSPFAVSSFACFASSSFLSSTSISNIRPRPDNVSENKLPLREERHVRASHEKAKAESRAYLSPSREFVMLRRRSCSCLGAEALGQYRTWRRKCGGREVLWVGQKPTSAFPRSPPATTATPGTNTPQISAGLLRATAKSHAGKHIRGTSCTEIAFEP